ncbi:MAG: hypothetical protein ACLRPV_04430 [Lacrimispora saccharolytica]
MVTSNAVVGSSQISIFGSQAKGDGDHYSLAHTAGKLMGILLLTRFPAPGFRLMRSISTASFCRFLRSRMLMRHEIFHNLLSDARMVGFRACQGILENDRALSAFIVPAIAVSYRNFRMFSP